MPKECAPRRRPRGRTPASAWLRPQQHTTSLAIHLPVFIFCRWPSLLTRTNLPPPPPASSSPLGWLNYVAWSSRTVGVSGSHSSFVRLDFWRCHDEKPTRPIFQRGITQWVLRGTDVQSERGLRLRDVFLLHSERVSPCFSFLSLFVIYQIILETNFPL